MPKLENSKLKEMSVETDSMESEKKTVILIDPETSVICDEGLVEDSKDNKLKGTKEKKCEEQISKSSPKERKKKTKPGSTLGRDKKKDTESKQKDPKMDIYIETVLDGDNIEASGMEDGGTHSGSVILQAIVDGAVSETIIEQTFGENAIIEGETYELQSATEETTTANNISIQSDTTNTTKNTKCKKKERTAKKDDSIEEEEILIPIDTGMVVEVTENDEGIESTSIPVNTPEKAPGYGYMSYAHNFGVDAETDDKESEVMANLTGDEQDKDKPKEKETLHPQYTVQSGYSPKSRTQPPKTTKTPHKSASDLAIKKSKKPEEENNITVMPLSSQNLAKANVSKTKTKAKNVASAKSKNTPCNKEKNGTSKKVKDVSTKGKNVSNKTKNVVSTKAQKKTSATLKAVSKMDSKTSPKINKLKSLKEASKESEKELKKRSSKARKNKIDRINQVMAALNNSPTSSADNTIQPLEASLSPTKEKTKKKKKSRTKDKVRKDKEKKKRKKHKSSKDKHELSGNKKKKKKAKKDKSESSERSGGVLDSVESPHHHHHHHHKPKKKMRKEKGKHRKKSESEVSPLDNANKLNKDKVKKLSDKLLLQESSLQSEKFDSKSNTSNVQKSPTKKRPLEKLYDIDVAEHTPKLKTIGRKTSKTKKDFSGKNTVDKKKSKLNLIEDIVKTANANKKKSKQNYSKVKSVDEPKLNISTPLHIDIPEDKPVQYAKGVGRGRGRGRRKYGTSRILTVNKNALHQSKELPIEKEVTTKPSTQEITGNNDLTIKVNSTVVSEEKEPAYKQLNNIEKDSSEPDNTDSVTTQNKKPSDYTEKDNKSKEQTPSPQSATTCMSEEGLFSDSGIGTDNNSNTDLQANDKTRKNNDVEIAPGVMASHPLATSAHGLYGYGKKEKVKKQMNWPVTLGRRKRKKHRLLRPATRITPEFIFELDALILQLRALKLDHPEELDENTLSNVGKKNHLSSLVKLTPGFSTMLRPSYLGTVMNIHTDKLKQKKKKKAKHKRRESKDNSDGKLISPISHHSGEPSESGGISPFKSVDDVKNVDSPNESKLQDKEVIIQEQTNVENKEINEFVQETNENINLESEDLICSMKEVEVQEDVTEKPKGAIEIEKTNDSTDELNVSEEPNVNTVVGGSYCENTAIKFSQGLIAGIPQLKKFTRVQRTRRRRGKGRGFTRKKMRGTYQSKKLQTLMSTVNIDSVINNDAIYETNNNLEDILDNDISDNDNFQDVDEDEFFNKTSSSSILNEENSFEKSVDVGSEHLSKQSLGTTLVKQSEDIKAYEQVKVKRKRGRPRQKGRKPGRPRKNPLPEIVTGHYSKDIVNEETYMHSKVSDIYEENYDDLEENIESNTIKEPESAVIIEQETLFLRRSPNINISPNEPVEKLFESTNHEFDSVKRKIDAAIKACVDKIKNTKRNLISHKYIMKPGPKKKGGVLSPIPKPNIAQTTLNQDETELKQNSNKSRLKAELNSQQQTKKKKRKSHKQTSAIEEKQGNELINVSDESSTEDEYEEEDGSLPNVLATSVLDEHGCDDILETLSDQGDSITSGKTLQKKVLKGGKGDKRKAMMESVECKLPLKKRKLTLTVKDDGTSASSETSLKIVSVTVDDDIELKETSVLPGSQSLKGFEKGSKGRKRRAEQRRRDDKPPKKKYWKAGMYSNSFKEDNVPKKSGKITDDMIERPASGFLPKPIHVGRYLREKRRDFTLPYDLWWLSVRKKLLSRQDNISFKKIRTNLHVDVKPTAGMEHVRCSCVMPPPNEPGCGDDCINRMTFTECNIDTCPCGDQCSNQRIQRHQWSPDLERFMTVDRGYGIMTKTAIKQHQFILEYVGEVISVKEFMKRATTDYQHRKHHYCLNLDSTQVIDGHRAGNEGRFVNHSCEPNCEMQKWCVQGVYRIALFSLRDIAADEELTYDYNFHAFSSEGQQVCKCKSPSCRGYIGGRTQKPTSNGGLKKLISNKRVGRPPKDKRKSKKTLKKLHDHSIESDSLANQRLQLPKPMSMREMKIIAERQILLIRNIEKVKRVREGLRRVHRVTSEPRTPKEGDKDVFMAQFRALNSSRSVKTRHLAAAEENTEVTMAARLAQVFKDIYTAVCTYRDTSGQCLAIPFMNLPSKKRNRDYYNRISEPIDLSTIERKIVTGHYKTVNSFDEDFKKLFRNAEKYHGKKSVLGRDAVHLFKVYSSAMTTSTKHFKNIAGLKSVAESTSKEDGKKTSKEDEEEEVIRCLCGLLNDEGLMIQCDTCMVWQHYDCIGLSYDEEPDHYVCELCKPREVADEIRMTPQPKYAQPGQTYYLCLTREDGTQVKMGDCVYLPRTQENNDTPIVVPANPINQSNHIFRVEQLWKNDKGERFAFGHHFLRPHETHHTPSRKFFKNELFRGPFYEIIRLDLISGFCCVMDLYTFCKGRPKNIKEEDVYICEYRLDKTAHLFHPISKNKFPICTKSYAFNKFEKKMIPKRDYSPHYVPEHYKRGYGGRPTWKCKDKTDDNQQGFSGKDISLKRVRKSLTVRKNNDNRQQKQKRVNAISQGLLDKLPGKQPVDLSFLLEVTGKRQRKKPLSESFV